jgi:hypothetical protein
MRCPSCGTDNAPDSRFCGGCGTRFTVSGQRVAPTQKISDDTSFPQRPLERQLAPGAGSAVPITAPGVVAPRAAPATPRAAPATPFLPQGAPPAQRPLAGGSAAPARPQPSPRRQAVVMEDPRDGTRGAAAAIDRDPRDATRGAVNGPAQPVQRGREAPRSIDPALSLPIAARRPWALIVVVLLIDLGLAGAGIWMLAHGLGDRPSRPAPPRSGEVDRKGTDLPVGRRLARQGRPIHPSASLAVRAGAAPSPRRPS